MKIDVKLLGIDIDYQLNFDKHIKNICRKASQQLSVLKRIGCFFFYLSLCNILKHSNAIVRILLICRDGTFAIGKSSSYVLL
jgi:hypothetical protein